MDNFSLIDRSTVAKEWHARGFSCGMWIDHAGREWSCQPHPHEELLMVLSGVLEIDVDGLVLRPSIGEEVRIPAGTSHRIKNVGGKTARWLYGQRRETTARPEISENIPEMTQVNS